MIIQSIGVEIECGISAEGVNTLADEYKEKLGLRRRTEMVGDSSVSVGGYSHPSAEFRFWGTVDEIKEFSKILFRKCGIEQNSSCGNHFHLKIDPTYAGIISHWYFVSKFLEKYREWSKKKPSKYKQREQNSYCRANEKDDTLLQLSCGSHSSYRYKAVNVDPLRDRGTVEIRIMPYADNYVEYERMIDFVVDSVEKIVNDYLKRRHLWVKRLRMNNEVLKEPYVIRKERLKTEGVIKIVRHSNL